MLVKSILSSRWALAISCLSFFVASQANPLVKRDSYQITGVTSGRGSNGSVPFRLEIRELEKNADQWNLYLIGVRRLMDMDQSEKLSWYQLMGMSRALYPFLVTLWREMRIC